MGFSKKVICYLTWLVMVFCSFTMVCTGQDTAEANEAERLPNVVVGLFKGSSATFRFSGDYVLINSSASEFVVPANTKLLLAIRDSVISWQLYRPGKSIKRGTDTGPLLITPQVPAPCSYFKVEEQGYANVRLEGQCFRGSLLATVQEKEIFISNVLDIESYVQSVVSAEIPDSWPEEVLKAQAIATRTYAAYKMGFTRSSLFVAQDISESFKRLSPEDIAIWADDQIYRGMLVESPGAAEATKATRGQVLTYQDKPVAAYYHADAAGMTEDARYVWGGAVPYLTGVKEIPHESPHSFWKMSMDENELIMHLEKFDVKKPIEMIYGSSPGVSGRWSKVGVKGPCGQVWLKGSDFRNALGLKSLLFSSYSVGSSRETRGFLNPMLDVRVAGEDSTVTIRLGTASCVGKSGASVNVFQGAHVVSVPQEGPFKVVFEGKGWGHGVGLSQWGARAMALSGSDFSTILMHYYPGTKLERWW